MQFDAQLPEGWRWETIESVQSAVARPVVTGPFGSSIGSKFFVDAGVPVIRGSNLSLSRTKFIDEGFVFLTEEKAAEFKNLEARPGDLVFTAAGTIGQVGIIPARPRFPRYIISNKQMRARLDTSIVEPLFAYYWFSEPYVQEYIRSRNTGSTIPLINLSVLKSLPIPVPPIDTQHGILGVIATLDDRIDLLRQTNATLESIAQALFKSWFIDFDPVRAKAEGREPEGMDAATAALFPAEFEESALGLIPRGWVPGTLADICTNPRAQAKPGLFPINTTYIGLEHMPRKSIALDRAGTAERLESGKFWFERNDVLFGKLRPYFHKVGLAPDRGVCSTDILVLRPKTHDWLGFLAMHASSDALIAYTTQLSNGARMPRTSWRDVGGFEVALPPQEMASAFNALVLPMFERIHTNVASARALAEVRDTLLPRLISGKLRLPEAEREIEEALA